jgi:hypothetical protein
VYFSKRYAVIVQPPRHADMEKNWGGYYFLKSTELKLVIVLLVLG